MNACVSDRIGDFAAELRDLPADNPDRATALKYLLHFVGDIHQPLHTADNHDAGGNAVLVLWGAAHDREAAARLLGYGRGAQAQA